MKKRFSLKDNKKLIIEIVSVVALLCIVIGVSFAGGYWSHTSSQDNTITTGDVSLTYLESTSEINLVNALPMSDKEGKLLNDKGAKFEFAVTTNSDYVQNINYDLNIESLVVDTGKVGLDPSDVKVYLTDKSGNVLVQPTKISDLDDFKLYTKKHKHTEGTTNITSKYVLRAWIDKDVVATNWYEDYTNNNKQYQYKFRVNVSGGSSEMNLDTSGANEPVLDDSMIPVYYDNTNEVWKKADESNSNETYKWYDYDNKMWANSVTVSSTNRSTYLNANPGTTIPMSDILTMQVWIPRYKYKVWNYNANGTATSSAQQIEITWEEGTSKTGEITCQDAISGTAESASEICKLKSTNATCTDSTCNNKTYTHPAFTFGDDELKGFWMGKFEISVPQDNDCYTTANETNCNKTGITPLVKPDVMSYRYAQVGTFETNMMAMNDNDNIYGLKTTTDTHMIKNSEWGAVAYLSHSKYGTCTDGTCREVNRNNSSSFYTGRSLGEVPTGGGTEPESYNNLDDVVVLPLRVDEDAEAVSYGSYTYDGYLLNGNTKTTTKDISKVASTTGNIYGIYDMSGGTYEYTMSNMVSSDGSTMMSGNSSSTNSGYTGVIYDSGNYTSYTGTYTYPANKYIDKYSFGTSATSRIKSKLGDGIKEVYNTGSYYGWYSAFSYVAISSYPWFNRGGDCYDGSNAGVFSSNIDNGSNYDYSARLVLAGLE